MKIKIFFLIVAMFLFNGLNNARELNDLAIVSAIGVDVDEKGQYVLTAQVLNTKKQNSSGGSSSSGGQPSLITVFNSSSSSVHGALRDMVDQSPKKLYIAHMELLLVSEKVAKSNMFETLDFFIRDNENSNDFILAITKDTSPKDILEVLTPLETNPTQSIKDSIEVTYKNKGTTIHNILSQNISIMLKPGINMVSVSIGLEGNPKEGQSEENIKNSNSKTKITVKELAYFDNRTLQGYLNEEEGIYYNLARNDLESAMLNLGTKEDGFVAEIIEAKCNSATKVENEEYIIDFDFKVKCAITEISKDKHVENLEEINTMQKQIEEKIKSEFISFVDNCKNKYNSDLIGFGNLYYKNMNKEYEKMQSKYGNDYLKHINVNCNVEVSLVNEGSVMSVW
ncbi:MAG: Ger(x)C family spore germination protein [Clostridia bacterium]|nr:Ger(x)C family spore germination protein [Clostridia bacterium]